LLTQPAHEFAQNCMFGKSLLHSGLKQIAGWLPLALGAILPNLLCGLESGDPLDWENFMNDTVANIASLSKEMPDTVRAFNQMGGAAKKDGALSEKTKEIMALGIAIATRCDSCIGFHVKSLIRLGITREELCEALAMATYMGGGPSYAYSAKALKAFEVFTGDGA